MGLLSPPRYSIFSGDHGLLVYLGFLFNNLFSCTKQLYRHCIIDLDLGFLFNNLFSCTKQLYRHCITGLSVWDFWFWFFFSNFFFQIFSNLFKKFFFQIFFSKFAGDHNFLWLVIIIIIIIIITLMICFFQCVCAHVQIRNCGATHMFTYSRRGDHRKCGDKNSDPTTTWLKKDQDMLKRILNNIPVHDPTKLTHKNVYISVYLWGH